MREVRIYVEGGGNTSDGRAAIRQGFSHFFESLRELARKKKIRWQIIACGGRGDAFNDFQKALRSHPDAFNILLVDAEGPVNQTPWAQLATSAGWSSPGVGDEHCHLMVQAVEAWLLADPQALASYYGKGFLERSIPTTANVESIPKDGLVQALEHATKSTQKGRYHKIKHCADLLERVDPAKVRQKAPHCERLFSELTDRL